MAQEDKQPRPCPQDCRQCSFQQHAYCAAQMSYTIVGALNALSERVANIEASMSVTDLAEPIAQEGSGAE